MLDPYISVILKLTDLQDVAPLLQDTNRIILTLFFQTNTKLPDLLVRT
jgi:hypothetical protein